MNDPELVSNVTVIHCLGTSDHNMLIYNIHMKSNENRMNRSQLDYKNADFDSIRADVATTDWDTMPIGNTHQCWSIFKATIKELESEYVQMKPVSAQAKRQSGWLIDLENW